MREALLRSSTLWALFHIQYGHYFMPFSVHAATGNTSVFQLQVQYLEFSVMKFLQGTQQSPKHVSVRALSTKGGLCWRAASQAGHAYLEWACFADASKQIRSSTTNTIRLWSDRRLATFQIFGMPFLSSVAFPELKRDLPKMRKMNIFSKSNYLTIVK